MEELSRSFRSFRLQRSSSSLPRIVGRSKSSRLVMESVSAECNAIAGYQRLSQSMRFFVDEPVPTMQMRKQQRGAGRTWRFLSCAFSGRKDVEVGKFEQTTKEKEIEKTKIKKKRSSWLPNPDRRWPVQGW